MYSTQADYKHSCCNYIVEVTGEGTYSAEPDKALVTLGVITENPSLVASQDEAAKVMTGVINSLLALGIPRENIKTIEYRIDPQYDYQQGTQILRGYKTTHNIEVTIDQVLKTGQIIDTAVNHGANSVSSVSFVLSQPEVAYNYALTLALRNAGMKAATISQSLGVRLNPIPIVVRELAQVGAPITPFAVYSVQAQASTVLEPGRLQVKARVDMKYSYFS